GGGVGGEVGVAGAGGADDDAPLLQVADGAAADERLGYLGHGDGGVDARVRAAALERVLQRKAVDHGGQHAHVIAGHAVDAFGGRGDAAKDVAAAYDDG